MIQLLRALLTILFLLVVAVGSIALCWWWNYAWFLFFWQRPRLSITLLTLWSLLVSSRLLYWWRNER